MVWSFKFSPREELDKPVIAELPVCTTRGDLGG